MDPTGVVILRANPIRPDPRVEKIGRVLAGAGYNVRALGWDRAGGLPPREQEAGFPIQRLELKMPPARGLRNLPALLRWQVALFNWLRRERASYQIIHACDFDTILPALWARRLWGKRVVYDIFDFYADMLRATPEPVRRAVRRLDLALIAQADAVLLADDARYAQIAGAHPRRSAVIYNAPEEQNPPLPPLEKRGVREEPRNLFLPTLRAPEGEFFQGGAGGDSARLRLCYVGLLQVERGLIPLLEVLGEHPEWHLDLAGTGAEHDQFAALAARLPNVTFHGRIPYAQAMVLNAQADVLPAFYDPAIPNHRFASPNKLFEGMLLGKPVLAARGTHFDEILVREDCGLVIDYGNREQLTAALHRLENPALRLRLGTNARHAYDTTYGWPRMRERLLEVYTSTL
jgi:glycosyltransferase involved in cell wall biosynthesis